MLSDDVLEQTLTHSKESAYKRGMELSVLERLLLLQLMPKEGNFLTLRLVRKLREDLSFSAEEHASLNFVEENGAVRWKTEPPIVKSVEIPPPMTSIIVEALQKLDADSKLTMETAALYERFLPKEEMSS